MNHTGGTRQKKQWARPWLAVLLLSSVSTVTTTASEGNTSKSKLPSVPLMERIRQGTQSIIPDASHHYHYGDDMLPLVEAPHVGGNHSSLGRRCIILDSRVFQPTKWQSILSSTGEHHDDNGTQWNVSNDQIVVEGDDIQMATITLKPGQTIRTRGGGSGLPDQWYPYEDRDCARSGITLSHQQSTLYD